MPYKNPEDKKAHDKRQWLKRYATWTGRVGQLIGSAKRRSKAKGHEMDITTAHLFHLLETQGYRCALTGKPFDLSPVEQYKNPWSPSVDRLDHDKGYTADNVRLVATIVNEARGQHTDEDLLLMCSLLLNPIQEDLA